MNKFLSTFFCVLAMTGVAVGLPEKNDGVLNKIKAGLEYATNYLETAKDIADLVAKSLSAKQTEKRDENSHTNEKGNFGPSKLMSAFFRLIGLDSQKVTAIAVNSVIFLVQMISSLFELKAPKGNLGRNFENDVDDFTWNPADVIAESKNERIQSLIEQAQDENLADQLIERVDGTDSACIRLLVCKTSPVIKAAQRFLRNRAGGKLYEMTSWLPSRDAFEENSDECEDTHADCRLFS